MKNAIIGILVLAMIFGCATDQSNNNTNAPDIQMDEEGVPMACDLILDTFIIEQFANAASIEKNGGKLEGNQGQRCQYQILSAEDQKVGQIVMMVKSTNTNINREEAAKRAKNTEYIDDLEFPASWRSFSNLHTLVFDHGNFTISMNFGNFSNTNKEELLVKAKQIANHVVSNLKANEI